VKGHHLFIFLENPLYVVSLIPIKEQVGEKRSTACTHRYADSLLKNTSTKHSIIMSSSVNVPEKTGLVNFNPSSSSIKIKPQKVSLLGHFRDSENSCFDGGKDHIISH
jgi:hypothetical protein